MSRKSQRAPQPRVNHDKYVDSDKAVGDLDVEDLIFPGVTDLELEQARMRWQDPTLTREGAKIKQYFQHSQAQAAPAVAAPIAPPPAVAAPIAPPAAVAAPIAPPAAVAAPIAPPAAVAAPIAPPPAVAARIAPPAAVAAPIAPPAAVAAPIAPPPAVAAPVPPPAAACSAAAPMPPPASAAAPMSPIVMDTSSEEKEDDAAVAQSRSSPKNGKKRARNMTLEQCGRTSMAIGYNGGTSSSKAVEGGSQGILAPSSSQDASEAGSQGILAPSSSQDASEAGSQKITAVWSSEDIVPSSTQPSRAGSPAPGTSAAGGNGAAGTASVPVGGIVNGYDAYRLHLPQDFSFMHSTWVDLGNGNYRRTNRSTDGKEHVVKWRRLGHDKWERQDPAG